MLRNILISYFFVQSIAYRPIFSRRGFPGALTPRVFLKDANQVTRRGFKVMHMSNLSDEEIMANWLEEMIYSGDMAGYVRRQSKDLICEQFLEFLQERSAAVTDEDEKQAILEALNIVAANFKLTDGMGGESGIAYEKRLDNILFIKGNLRKAYVQEHPEELTDGFLEYIQKELKSTEDQDSKVVLASILKIVSEVKGSDYLGGASIMLSRADETLGEEYAQKSLADVVGAAQNGASGIQDRNEQILASLTFSTNDIVEDVLNNLHEIDERFTTFLQKKMDATKDIEERVGLQSLLETISAILERIKEVEDSVLALTLKQ